MSASSKFYSEVRGVLKGVGRESVIPQWILAMIKIYGTWYVRLFMAYVEEVGALITDRDSINYTNFSYLTCCDFCPK